MYPLGSSPDGTEGSLVRISLDPKFVHDGQTRRSWVARSTLSSNPLFNRTVIRQGSRATIADGPVAQLARAHP